MKIKAAITHALGEHFSLEEVDLSDPKDNEVLIRIVASGVCHTDAVARDAGLTPFPVESGYEGSGVVEKVGSQVTSLEAGDHVVIAFAIPVEIVKNAFQVIHHTVIILWK